MVFGNVKTQHEHEGAGTIQLTDSGSPVTDGVALVSLVDPEKQAPVYDSPTFSEGRCTAIRVDGVPCVNELTTEYQLKRQKCVGHFRMNKVEDDSS